MAETKSPTNLALVKDYFGMSAKEFMAEKKGDNPLTTADIEQLGEGIRNGSLTY